MNIQNIMEKVGLVVKTTDERHRLSLMRGWKISWMRRSTKLFPPATQFHQRANWEILLGTCKFYRLLVSPPLFPFIVTP